MEEIWNQCLILIGIKKLGTVFISSIEKVKTLAYILLRYPENKAFDCASL